MKFIDGAIVSDADTDTRDHLRDELDTIRQENQHLRNELAIAKHQSDRALGALRKQLHPLYITRCNWCSAN